MTTTDPLVRLWRETSRPLNWRHWQRLTDAEQATLRFSTMRELAWCDWDARPAFWWTHTHREILELKAAGGHGKETA